MGELTKIQWCHHTHNPWRGCRKVSEECEECYIVDTFPFRSTGQTHGSIRVRASTTTLKEPLRWNLHAGAEGVANYYDGHAIVRPRVFCLSLGDWLDDENVPIEWFADLLGMINDTPNLDWLLLTKRPQNWRKRVEGALKTARSAMDMETRWLRGEPPQNVWIGVSVGADQSAALDIPARIHFLSAEPMLKPLNSPRLKEFHWVVLGGESGRNARPCDIEWIRDGVKQCQTAGAAPFVKQLGAVSIASNPDAIYSEPRNSLFPGTVWQASFKDKKGGDMEEWIGPLEDLKVREFPQVCS